MSAQTASRFFTTRLAAAVFAALSPLAVSAGDFTDPLDWVDAKADLSEPAETRALAAEQAPDAVAAHDALLERALRDGPVPVIVRLREDDAASGRKFAASAEERRSALAATQKRVLDALPAVSANAQRLMSVKQFSETRAIALQADAGEIEQLLSHPDVAEVVEDVAFPPALAASVPWVGGSAGVFAGYSGAGQVVAVLDTGVAKSHPFLAGKVVSEACYSTTNSSGVTSLCPGGVTSSTAAGSGVNCDASLSGCAHGTHVAGIVAGNNGSYSGVARDARIIAVQVFSRFPASSCGSTNPCVMAYTSDIIRGLERVRALTGTYSIAAANMSLGGGGFGAACDSDPTKSAIDSLRAVGVATVIASGNSGYNNAISSPACISSAISVGSTNLSDQVSSFSNSASILHLLAPGAAINSSVPGTGYGRMSGTSMAAPHVAGAWAVLKSAKPSAGVAEVLGALQATGVPVTDPDNGIVKPRIAVDAAVAQLVGGQQAAQPPAAPTANAPTVVSQTGFTASWNSVTGATAYRLDVSTSSSFASFLPGYQDLNVSTATSRAVSGLSGGTTYYYRVRAVSQSGVSANSNVRSVTTLAAAPAAVQSVSAGAITTTGFSLGWAAAANATGYLVDVATDSGFKRFVSGFRNRSVGAVTSVAVTGLKANTVYYARVRATSAVGVGANSATVTVRTMILTPSASAARSITAGGFNATWRSVQGATGYVLDVAKDAGFTNFVTGFQARAVGATTSAAVSNLDPGVTYFYRVRAVGPVGTTPNSNVVSATTKALAKPTVNAASAITTSSMRISWRAVAGAVGYRLDVATDSGFRNMVSGYAGRDMGSATSVDLTGLQSKVTYYYRVRAYSRVNETANSAVRNGRTR